MANLKTKGRHVDHQKVVDYLVSNQELLKEKLLMFPKLREALMQDVPKLLHGDIKKQYEQEVRSYVIEVVAINSGIDSETIHDVLDDMDLKEYLGSDILSGG